MGSDCISSWSLLIFLLCSSVQYIHVYLTLLHIFLYLKFVPESRFELPRTYRRHRCALSPSDGLFTLKKKKKLITFVPAKDRTHDLANAKPALYRVAIKSGCAIYIFKTITHEKKKKKKFAAYGAVVQVLFSPIIWPSGIASPVRGVFQKFAEKCCNIVTAVSIFIFLCVYMEILGYLQNRIKLLW